MNMEAAQYVGIALGFGDRRLAWERSQRPRVYFADSPWAKIRRRIGMLWK